MMETIKTKEDGLLQRINTLGTEPRVPPLASALGLEPRCPNMNMGRNGCQLERERERERERHNRKNKVT